MIMDPLSVTASIVAVVQLTETVLSYINGIKEASKEASSGCYRDVMYLGIVYSLPSNTGWKARLARHWVALEAH